MKAAQARRLVLSDLENALSSDQGRGASPKRPYEAGQQQEWDKIFNITLMQTPLPLENVGPPSHRGSSPEDRKLYLDLIASKPCTCQHCSSWLQALLRVNEFGCRPLGHNMGCRRMAMLSCLPGQLSHEMKEVHL